MDSNKIKDYDSAMLLATQGAVQLCDLTKSMILNTHYVMKESAFHAATEYFKASFKKSIELDNNLSDTDKENQKRLVDTFCLMWEGKLNVQLTLQGRLIKNL